MNITPVKGMVWLHAMRTDYKGEPLKLTVTSVGISRKATTYGKQMVYSTTQYRDKIRTPLDVFEKMCAEVVSVPDESKTDAAPKLSRQECVALYNKAHAAGVAAAQAVTPVPLVVVEHEHVLDDNSPVVRRYAPEPEGVCGVASVVVRPGNSSFANYLKSVHDARRAYYGGMQLFVRAFGQSYERKRAYAAAFAGVLNDAGVRANVDSRLD